MQLNGSLVSDPLNLPEVPTQNRLATESSRILLGLMELSHSASNANPSESAAFEGLIAPSILRKLLSTLHFRDATTVQHSRRVAQIAVGIAQRLTWEGLQVQQLEIAALLHDVGKIGVPDNILFKPGKLHPDEADLMALHHSVAVDVLQACRVNREVTQIIAQSRDFAHDAAKGVGRNVNTLSLGARILSVADAYDSLRTDQVYRRGKSHDDTLRILVENAGVQFDGNVVKALARWANECGLSQAGADYRNGNRLSETGPEFADHREALEADTLCRTFAYLYLLENLYDGFYVIDSDLRFVVWSGGLKRLLGHTAEDLLHATWTSRMFSYVDTDGREIPEADLPMRQVVETGQPVATTVHIRQADGTIVDVELQTVPLLDDRGQLRGVAEILRDTSRHQLAPREYRDLRLAASRDPLTGVANRGELESQLTRMLADSLNRDWKVPCSIIFIDVDHFKPINDRFGHATGDIVLIEIARLLQQETYSGELVGRYGGEEFVILCPATELDQAINRSERIRLAISSMNLAELKAWPLSASFGVTQAGPGDTADSFLRRADKALYAAKDGGRDQTCFIPTEVAENSSRANQASTTKTTGDSYEFVGSFHACTAAEMIVYKLGAFVNEQNARLLEIVPGHVRLRLGRLGLLGKWGKADEKQPVEVDLDFSQEVPPRDVNGKSVKSNQVLVVVKIRPVGRSQGQNLFESRASQVLKQLATFFLAEV